MSTRHRTLPPYVSQHDTTYQEDKQVDWTGQDYWVYFRHMYVEYGDEDALRDMLRQVTKDVPRPAPPAPLYRKMDRHTWIAIGVWITIILAICILPWVLRLRYRRYPFTCVENASRDPPVSPRLRLPARLPGHGRRPEARGSVHRVREGDHDLVRLPREGLRPAVHHADAGRRRDAG